MNDGESARTLEAMTRGEKVRMTRIPGVRTVLIVLSARSHAFDLDALRLMVMESYPDAAVFCMTAAGEAVGMVAPRQVDLLIDFTAPRQREPLFLARKLRNMARVAVGRKAGWLRKRVYNRVFDENAKGVRLPADCLDYERIVQSQVLELAGIAVGSIRPFGASNA